MPPPSQPAARQLTRNDRGTKSRRNADPANSASEDEAIPNSTPPAQYQFMVAVKARALAACKQRGIESAAADRLATKTSRMAARTLFEGDYIPSVETPTKAERLWDERDRNDPEENDPTQFLDKYWGQYLDEGVLDQCTFRKLDPRLFEAIKWKCQRDGLKLAAYLPPPARQHATSVCASGDQQRSVSAH